MKGYVLLGVSVAIVILGIFLIFKTLQNNVEIQNIQVQPSTIKVGDTFTVHTTLVNNSQNPIYVNVSPCLNTVIFDTHVTVDVKKILCDDILGWHKVNPSENFTVSYPDDSENFRATNAGTTDATVTLSYSEKMKVADSKTISKSFSFTILDK